MIAHHFPTVHILFFALFVQLVQLCIKIPEICEYSGLSLNGHLYKTDTSVKRTLRVGPCLSLLPLFDSL